MGNKQKIDLKLKERFNHVYWSIYLYNLSLSELKIISEKDYNQSELKIVNSHTFDFYKVTLQYCFVMEYNKVLEKGRKNKNQNISSIIQLNDSINSLNMSSSSDKFIYNEKRISNLKSSTFYKKIRSLRDKKIAHADTSELNAPFSIKGFSKVDFENGFYHLSVLKDILNDLTSIYDFEYALQIPNKGNKTENFIRFHAVYKDFYHKNTNRAIKK